MASKVQSAVQSYFSFFTGLCFLTVCVFCFLAALVPQWMVVNSPLAQSIGLFRQCANGDCQGLNPPAQYVSLKDDGTQCIRKGSDFQDRMRVSGAFWVIGIICHGVALIITFMGISGKFLFKKTVWIGAAVLTGVAVFLYLIGLMISSITINHWMFCGRTFCDVAGAGTTDCGFAFSFYCGIIAIIGGLVCVGLYGASLVLSKAQQHHNARVLSGLIGLGIFVVAIIATGTPYWMGWNQGRLSTGLFSWCQGTDCHKLRFPPTASYRAGCTVEGGKMRARYDATAAFLFITFLLTLVAGVGFLLFQCKVVARPANRMINFATMGFMVLMGFFIFLSLVIYGHTMDSYMKCGVDYCEGIDGCGYGFSFAVAVISIIILAVLLVLHLFEHNRWLWFKGGPASGGSEPTNGTSSSSSSKTTTTTTTTSKTTVTTTTSSKKTSVQNSSGRSVPLPSGGDWEFDADSGYYWSDTRGLFWDVESEMFYNPDTEDWFA